MRLSIPAPAAGDSTRTVVGIPFNRASLFRGAITAVTSSTIKSGSPSWTPGQFTGAVHFIKMRSGANAGRYFQVTANTADSITVSAPGVTLAVKDTFEVFPAQTLASFFGAAGAKAVSGDVAVVNGSRLVTVSDTSALAVGELLAGPGIVAGTTILQISDGATFTLSQAATADATTISYFPVGFTGKPVALRTGATAADADLVRLHDGTAWVTYFNNGTQWVVSGSDESKNNTIIRPEQGVVLECGGTSAVNLAFGGAVSVDPQISAIPGAGEALISNRFPLPTSLGTLGLQGLTGWLKGPTASQSDTAMTWNGASWNIYYHNGTRWQMAGSPASQDAAQIPAGGAVLIRRKDGSTATSTLHKTVLPFTYKTSN